MRGARLRIWRLTRREGETNECREWTDIPFWRDRRAARAVHIQRQADDQRGDLVFVDQFADSIDDLRISLFFSANRRERARDQLQFVRDRDADAALAVVKRHHSHAYDNSPRRRLASSQAGGLFFSPSAIA